MRHTRAVFLIPIAIALIGAACGGGSDNDDPSTDGTTIAGTSTAQAAGQSADITFAPDSYQAQLKAIVDKADAEIIAASESFKTASDAAFAEVANATDPDAIEDAVILAYDVVLDEAAKIVPIVIPIMERAIDEIEALDTPTQFVGDHARFLEAMRQQLGAQRDVGIAAADRDLERFLELAPRTDEIEAGLFAEISPEFRTIVAAFLDDAG